MLVLRFEGLFSLLSCLFYFVIFIIAIVIIIITITITVTIIIIITIAALAVSVPLYYGKGELKRNGKRLLIYGHMTV